MMFKNLLGKSKKLEKETGGFELIYKIIRELLPDDIKEIQLAPETKFEDLGFDSMQYIQLILNLEDVVDKDLEEIATKIDLASLRTINDVVQLVDSFSA